MDLSGREGIFSGMELFDKKKQNLAENTDFVRFIQVLKEEPEIRKTVKKILALDDFNRRSALNTWLEELKYKQAPPKFRLALSCLLDDDIARQTLDIIRE